MNRIKSNQLRADSLRILAAARHLLLSGWCTGALAQSSDGYIVDTCSPNAVRWCAIGAIKRAGHDLGYASGTFEDQALDLVLNAARFGHAHQSSVQRGQSAADWNDAQPNALVVTDAFSAALKAYDA